MLWWNCILTHRIHTLKCILGLAAMLCCAMWRWSSHVAPPQSKAERPLQRKCGWRWLTVFGSTTPGPPASPSDQLEEEGQRPCGLVHSPEVFRSHLHIWQWGGLGGCNPSSSIRSDWLTNQPVSRAPDSYPWMSFSMHCSGNSSLHVSAQYLW